MYAINEQIIRDKVMNLMKSMGVSKKKFGEVLGSKGDHVNVRINRANRFLTGDKKKLTIQEINRIAEFFGKPATWFFYKDSGKNESLGDGGAVVSNEEVLQKIEGELRQLGFEESYIGIQIQQIRAMAAFRSAHK